MSKQVLVAGDVAGLLAHLGELQRKTAARTGTTYPIISVYEAGYDGFWLHRVLVAEGIESHVVDPASITTSRRCTMMVELAWLWLKHQPDSALSLWFRERVKEVGRIRKTLLAALARKLLVAFWKYGNAGVVIAGARMKAA